MIIKLAMTGTDKNGPTTPAISPRSRITHVMNKFREMGLIDYNGELTVRTELFTDLVLHD